MSTRQVQRDAWLRTTLQGRRARLSAASEDASFRRYFRVHLDGDTRILMDAPPPQENCRPFVQVTRLLAAAGLNIPAIFAADLEQGFLLLSDLGDRHYLQGLDEASADALYADAIDALVRLQRRGDASSLPRYDRARLLAEMRLFVQWFLGRHLGIAPDARSGAVLEQAFATLVAACEAQPQVLVHRDYHSRNLMITASARPGVLDYQDAVLGPVGYDLVSLLRDVYVRWPPARVAQWVERYHRQAVAAGVLHGTGPDAFRRWFDLCGVQRHLKVAGIFARLYYRDGKNRYLADIALTLRYLLEVVRTHPELAPLGELLDAWQVTARHDAAVAALARADAAR
jgi:hypothetical protein